MRIVIGLVLVWLCLSAAHGSHTIVHHPPSTTTIEENR